MSRRHHDSDYSDDSISINQSDSTTNHIKNELDKLASGSKCRKNRIDSDKFSALSDVCSSNTEYETMTEGSECDTKYVKCEKDAESHMSDETREYRDGGCKKDDNNIVVVVSEMRVDILRILMMLKHITKTVVAQKKKMNDFEEELKKACVGGSCCGSCSSRDGESSRTQSTQNTQSTQSTQSAQSNDSTHCYDDLNAKLDKLKHDTQAEFDKMNQKLTGIAKATACRRF